MVIVLLKCFTQVFFSWVSRHLMKPLKGFFQHLLGQDDTPLFLGTVALMHTTYDVINVFIY
jgi:hypothetical protein